MKKLIFKNYDIPEIMNFLNRLSLKPQPTRGKHKLLNRLEDKLKEYGDSERELLKMVSVLDEEGELKFNGEGKPTVRKDVTTKDSNEYLEEKQKLDNEEVVIEFAEYSKKYESFFKALNEYDREIPSDVSRGYSILMDTYEENEETKEEE